MIDLSEKVVVVTGCTGGIGRVICNQLALSNAIIAGICRSADSVYEHRFKEYNNLSFLFYADVSRYESCIEIMNEIYRKFRRIDILINCAGYIVSGAFENLNEIKIDSLIKNNLYGVIYPIKTVIPIMIKQGIGKIITIGSLGGIVPMPFEAVYSSTKFAVRGFSLSLAKELKEKGIDVSLISPGSVKTKMLDLESSDDNSIISFVQNPLEPEIVADAVIRVITHPEIETIIPKTSAIFSLLLNIFPVIFYKIYPLAGKFGRDKLKRYRKKYIQLRES